MYSTSQLKYGWYEIIGKDAVCRIKPIYDEQVRPCITDTGEIYSVVKQNGLFGIIKFNDKRFPTNYKIQKDDKLCVKKDKPTHCDLPYNPAFLDFYVKVQKNEKYALVKQNEFWGLIKFKENAL